jgi:hypothetical protein
MDKESLLKEYVAMQAEDHGLWFDAETAPEAYLQQELRRVAYLIEEATLEEIQEEINRYKGRI